MKITEFQKSKASTSTQPSVKVFVTTVASRFGGVKLIEKILLKQDLVFALHLVDYKTWYFQTEENPNMGGYTFCWELGNYTDSSSKLKHNIELGFISTNRQMPDKLLDATDWQVRQRKDDRSPLLWTQENERLHLTLEKAFKYWKDNIERGILPK